MIRRNPTILAVITVHLLLMAMVWFVPRFLNRMKPASLMPDAMFVSLVSPEPSIVDAPPVEAVQPEPPPAQPDTPPPPQKKKKKIEISTKRVVREQAPQSAKKLTPEEIRKQLKLNSRTGAVQSAKLPLPGWYYASVREILYGAWTQPAGLAGASDYKVRVRLTVARNGQIRAKNILHHSGHAEMDRSVKAALSAVERLKALPTQYSGAEVDITITFELERG